MFTYLIQLAIYLVKILCRSSLLFVIHGTLLQRVHEAIHANIFGEDYTAAAAVWLAGHCVCHVRDGRVQNSQDETSLTATLIAIDEDWMREAGFEHVLRTVLTTSWRQKGLG